MFARTCPRASRTGAVRSILQERPSRSHHCLLAPSRRSQPIRWKQSPLTNQHHQRRNPSFQVGAAKLLKENPFSVSLAAAIILFGMGALVYTNVIYQRYIVGDFKAFPEPVAAKLRRALYYTNIDMQPKNAVKYYRQALAVANELGMDPFSDEMLGVKIQLSSLFEKAHMYQKSIDVLEIVRSDCLRWLEEVGNMDGMEGQRTRVLGKTIGISVKLGEYYANEHIQDQEAAEERLVWAVTAVLREQKRREDEGVKDGEGAWMSNEEIGGALESLGHVYEAKDQHYLSAPLFLQALGLCPPTSCHSVVLMNNLAISLAQQNPPPSLSPSQAPASPSSHVSDARQWALSALALAASIKPPERTEECDEGCAVATINLGDFALIDGDIVEARRRYEEGKSISKGIGFMDGVTMANENLKELGKGR